MPEAEVRKKVRTRTRRRGLLVTLFAVLAAATAVFAAAPAQASYVGNSYLRNWDSGLCLEAYVPTLGSYGVWAKPCVPQSAPYQRWQTWEPEYLTTNGHDIVQIRNIQVNKCLNAYYNNGLYMSLYTCDSSLGSQMFEAIPGYDGAGWNQVRLQWFGDFGASQCIENNYAEQVNFEYCNPSLQYGKQLWKLGL